MLGLMCGVIFRHIMRAEVGISEVFFYFDIFGMWICLILGLMYQRLLPSMF